MQFFIYFFENMCYSCNNTRWKYPMGFRNYERMLRKGRQFYGTLT